MGASLPTPPEYLQAADSIPGPELGFLSGLGRFIANDKSSAPSYLLQADYSRTVNVAVAGNAGTGKSLLINTLRGVKPGDPSWAPVGVTETTREPTWYEFPGEPRSSVRLWDMEGAGGCCSWDNYTGNVGLRYFDVVLLLCSARLTDSDMDILQELERQSVPFLFVRTKLDEDIKNNQTDCGMTPQQTEESIRKDLETSGITSPFLINARKPQDHDFPKLVKDIVHRLEVFERQRAEKVAAANAAKEAAALAEQTLAVQAEEAAESTAAEGALAVADDGEDNFYMPEGFKLEPLEQLAADGGHWIWVDDDGLFEYFEHETGSVPAYFMAKMSGVPEHTYSVRPDGVWECKVKNFWTTLGTSITGRETQTVFINPNNKESNLQLQVVNTRKLVGTSVEYIEGRRLVTEQKGQAEKFDGKQLKEDYKYRCNRLVTNNNQYWIVFENVIDGRRGTRRFRRYPFYRIQNETEQPVTMKTYAIGALFSSPTSTVVVEPGTHCIDCYKSDADVEQAIFSLPNRAKYTVPRCEPFGTYCLKREDFS